MCILYLPGLVGGRRSKGGLTTMAVNSLATVGASAALLNGRAYSTRRHGLDSLQ